MALYLSGDLCIILVLCVSKCVITGPLLSFCVVSTVVCDMY